MVAYDGLLKILHHDLKKNLRFHEYVFVAIPVFGYVFYNFNHQFSDSQYRDALYM